MKTNDFLLSAVLSTACAFFLTGYIIRIFKNYSKNRYTGQEAIIRLVSVTIICGSIASAIIYFGIK